MKFKNSITPLSKFIFAIVAISIFIPIWVSCGSSVPTTSVTRRLFMQSRKANIELPPQEGLGIGVNTGGGRAFTSEVVTYANPNDPNVLSTTNAKLDTNSVYRLNEIVVVSRSRFTPERNGRVNLDFEIKVPKELLSPKWSITMVPELVTDDSIQHLQEIVIKGQEFYDEQRRQYKAYDDFINSIVSEQKYDSVFLDTHGIQRDIRNRQEFFYDQYHKEWARQMEYEQWKGERDERIAYYAARREAYLNALYNEYAIKEQEETIRNIARGKDTTGIHDRYKKEYEKKAENQYEYWTKRLKALQVVPKKFQDIYESGRTLEDITNMVVVAEDSARIAQHRYQYDRIAQNEMKAARKDEVFKEMVIFPYSETARIDSVIDAAKDFSYYYKLTYPINPKMKKISIIMKGKVQAVDRSTFTLPVSDSLSYYISSLAQLVDTSLIYKETMVRKNAYQRATAYTDYPPNGWTFDPRTGNNRAEMGKIIETLRTLRSNNDFAIDSVVMVATSSLDGSYTTNADLSRKRSQSAKEYIVKQLSGEVDVENLFKARYKGEDWNGLASYILKRNDLQNKDQIITMLQNATDPDECEREIKKNFRSDYKIIQDSIYPLLRKIDFTFYVNRVKLDNDSLFRDYRSDYAQGIELLQNRDYWKAIEILANYPDYNAALCLLCMGMNEKAEEVLDHLESNANNEYLLAIAKYRLKKPAEAEVHLLKSIELDPSKLYRATLDSEIRQLILDRNMQSKLRAIEAKQVYSAGSAN